MDNPLPFLLLEGIEQFNERRLDDCHETFDGLWMTERKNPEVRNLLKGLIQICVGLIQERMGNRKGAVRLLTNALELLRPLAPAYLGIDVGSLVESSSRLKRFLEESPGRVGLPSHLIPCVRFTEGPLLDRAC
ncbi:MAG: DUF309 domain-containing protein [Acidobacteriota bacterium]